MMGREEQLGRVLLPPTHHVYKGKPGCNFPVPKHTKQSSHGLAAPGVCQREN